MKITLFGSTGSLGRECLQQGLDAGHDITVLVRNPGKLPADLAQRVTVIVGDALVPGDVAKALPHGTEAVLFAIGVDEKTSPPDLCTDATRHILKVMRERKINRLIWCGGGSNLVDDDIITFGARFVRWYAEVFLKHRHMDKEHQLTLLNSALDIHWIGIRPLQMNPGIKTGRYRLGFNAFSGLSKITFADCAHAMLGMLDDDTWVHKAPIIQY